MLNINQIHSGYGEIKVLKDNLIITTQKNKLIPPIQIDYLKKLIAHGIETGDYTEDDIWRALKIIKS